MPTPSLDPLPASPLAAVVNATGVVLHPKLGRAPLSAAARQAVLDASGYTTLEIDQDTGRHQPRTSSPGRLAAEVLGAPAATVVNNGAAALLLTLHALATDREVVVSRGELVEIGRSYRLPDLIATTPARLVEVGTANHTRLEDYRSAAHHGTGVLLTVHRPDRHPGGNETSLAQLAELAAELGVPLVHHLGSGLPHRMPSALPDEPSVGGSLTAGADLVLVSGDKLLGGPQAGIIAGRADLVASCERHALARALRIDKLQRAALEATLWSWAQSELPADLPVVAMLDADPVGLHQRAVWMADQIGRDARAVRSSARVGGSLLSAVSLPSWAVAVPCDDPQDLAATLLAGDPPLLVRVEGDHLRLDVRTIPPSRDVEVAEAVRELSGG